MDTSVFIRSLKNTFLAMIAVVLVVSIGVLSRIYYVNHTPKPVATAETNIDTVAFLKQFMDLPDETPLLATVTDKDKLYDKQFFEKAQNGDQLLIFTAAKKAVLYRPSAKKLIEFGPLLLPESPQVKPPSGTDVLENIRVSIYNGTERVGWAADTKQMLLDQFKTLSVIKTGDAYKAHSRTLIVDVHDDHEAMTQEIATLLDAEVGALPQNEPVSVDADIIIFLGQ